MREEDRTTIAETVQGIPAEEDFTTYTHSFDKPFEWEGKTYEELTFRFGSLRGRDVVAIMHELRSRGMVIAAKAFDIDYQYRYAIRCCAQPIDATLLLGLPERDFNAICGAAQRFLAGSGR